MYDDINREITRRISEVREHLDAFTPTIPAAPIATPRQLNTQKGLVFVELYGLIEYMMNQVVARTAYIINGESLNISNLTPYLWAMALDSELESLRATNRKKWDRRNRLFSEIVNNPSVTINEELMPTNGKNFTSDQLESVWKTLNIQDSTFNDQNFSWRLKDIVINRNHIAHGNQSAAALGASFTATDLYTRLDEVSAYCSYVLSVFESYISNKHYLV